MRNTKRLAAILFFLVITIVLITVTVSAEGNTNYKVVDKSGNISYTDSWTTAVDTASGGGRIYLNKNITVTSALVPKNSKGEYVDTTFDLNGKTITNNTGKDNALFMLDPEPVSFSIIGEGTINTKAYPVVRVSAAKDDKRINLLFDGYGKGITVHVTDSISANGGSCLFHLDDGANTTLRGDIIIQPKTHSGFIFQVGTEGSSYDSYMTLDGARLTVEAPWDAGSYLYMTYSAYLMTIGDSAHVTVKNHSIINMEHGSVFKFEGVGGDISGTIAHTDAEITGITGCSTYIPINKWIDIDDSEIIADTKFAKVTGGNGAGHVFTLKNFAAEIRVDNSKIVSAYRLADGTTTASLSSKSNILTPGKIYFKNVDYVTSENSVNTGVKLAYGRLNFIWDGGTIEFKNGVSTKLGTMTLYSDGTYFGTIAPGKITMTADCFSSEAEAELRKQTNNQAISFGERTTLKITISTVYRGDDGNVYENASEYNGATTAISKLVYEYSTSGAVAASNAIGGYSYKYSELDYTVGGTEYNDWFGVGFKNVCFVTAPGASKTTAINSWAAYKTFGTEFTNKTVIEDGKATTYAKIFWDYTTDYRTTSAYTMTNVFNPTSETEGGEYAGIAFSDTAKVSFREFILSTNGSNGYVRYRSTSAAGSGGYLETKLGVYGKGNTSGVTSAASHPLTDYSYVIQEFDINTDDGAYPTTNNTGARLLARYVIPTYTLDNSGTGFKVSSVTTSSITSSSQRTLFSIKADGTLYGSHFEFTEKEVKLPTDGSWARITVVYEIHKVETTYKPVSGSELTLPAYDFSGTRVHIYLDGEWIASSNGSVINQLVDKAYASTFGLDSVRFEINAPGDTPASIGFDNMRVAYLKSADDLDGLERDFKASLIGKDAFMIMPDNNSDYTLRTGSPIASVDGKDCYTEEEISSAIEENSIVNLKSNIANPLYSNNTRFTVLTNNYSFKGIVSKTNRIYITELDGGTKYDAIPALADEIYTVVYDDSNMTGFTNSATKAALGSYIEIIEAAQSENAGSKLDPETGILYVINYWTLDKNKEISRLAISPTDVSDGKVTLVAVHRSSDEKATVIWQDAEGNEIARDYYVPGNGVFATPNDGSLVPSTPMANGWYEIGFIGWNEDPASVELTAVATYVFTPKMGARLSSGGVPGIKINVSVYTDFELNIFIPETIPEGIENVVLSRTPDGKTPVRPNAAASNATAFNPTSVTVGGVPYTRYIDSFATADTSVKTYYLVFTVDGNKFVQTIKYGIPYYASALMADNSADIESKALVMNIVNYADKLIKLLGKEGDDGARIYSGLLKKYGTGTGYDYLESYELLYDERFAEADDPSTDTISNDIYDGIASLTYKNAAGYINSASILFTESAPVFVFEYGPKAISNYLGIKKPTKDNGYYAHDSLGVFLYFQYSGDEKKYPAAHYAYEGDIYSGTKLTMSDSIWLTDTVALVDGNGTRYYYDYKDNRYEDAEGNAYAGDISKLVYADDIKYYAVAHPYRYTNHDRGWQKVYDLINPVEIDVRCWDGSTTYLAKVNYSLAAYIKGMIDSGETKYAELGKALYAYALAAHNFKNRVDLPDLGEPVAENSAQTLGDGVELVATENNVYSNKSISFYCEFDALGVGDEIYLGHAVLPTLDASGNYVGGAYASSYMIITRSTIQFVNYYSETNHNIAVTPGTPKATTKIYNHGLYISDFLEVRIEADKGVGTLVLKTANGTYTQENINWVGRQGKILAKPVGLSLSNVSLEWHCDALSEDLWVFGASYLNYTDNTRWPYYMVKNGYDECCLIGYPGMGATPALENLEWALSLGYRPKVIAWTVGMNNADTAPTYDGNGNMISEGSIHQGWLADTEAFIAICEEYGITPVLCTIPNTPIRYNGAKNEWIRNSGYRYINMSASVGSDEFNAELIGKSTGVADAVSDVNKTGYAWTEGYISKDLVHPSAAGGEAMYRQFLIDLPEITGDYTKSTND